MIDEELKSLAALALRNAFWRDFSALCEKYLDASGGLDLDAQEAQMSELTSVYGRSRDASSTRVGIDIMTARGGLSAPAGLHGTLMGALSCSDATEAYLCGRKVFERRDGEWYFTG